MLIIIHHWIQALLFLFSFQFLDLVISAIKNLFWALKDLVLTFWWLLFIEFVLLFFFGQKILLATKNTATNHSMMGLIIHVAVGITSIILYASTLLFIRNPNTQNPLFYVKKIFDSLYPNITLFCFIFSDPVYFANKFWNFKNSNHSQEHFIWSSKHRISCYLFLA
ncbi:MAG: hypothetical protein V1855_00945 [bacterium]